MFYADVGGVRRPFGVYKSRVVYFGTMDIYLRKMDVYE